LRRLNVLIVHSDCSVIVDVLKEDLKKDDIAFSEIALRSSTFSDVSSLINHAERINNSTLIICHPLNPSFLPKILVMLIAKPRKLILIIPPSPQHKRNSIVEGLTLYLLRALLTFMKLRNRILYVFTTPYERLFATPLVEGFQYVYYPAYPSIRQVSGDVVPETNIVIAFFPSKKESIKEIGKALSMFKELGFKQLVVVSPLTRVSESSPCWHVKSSHTICVITDDHDDIIAYSTLVVVDESTPESNSIVYKAVLSSKLVIASSEHGLALYYRDKWLTFLYDKFRGEDLVAMLVNILNDLDKFKKLRLSPRMPSLKRDLGRVFLVRFLREES